MSFTPPGTLILTISQAQAVYSAMCELNNVSMHISAEIRELGRLVTVREDVMGRIHVEDLPLLRELYEDQTAFANAYSLQTG